MYFYKVKIESGEKSIDINDDTKNHFINEVNIIFDTIGDDSREKSTAMIARIDIKGNIERDINNQLKEIFDWSKDFKKSSTYRKVTIEVYDDEENILRTYSFGNMFVRDYKECYNNNEKGDKGGTFELNLSQLERSFDSAEVFLG